MVMIEMDLLRSLLVNANRAHKYCAAGRELCDKLRSIVSASEKLAPGAPDAVHGKAYYMSRPVKPAYTVRPES